MKTGTRFWGVVGALACSWLAAAAYGQVGQDGQSSQGGNVSQIDEGSGQGQSGADDKLEIYPYLGLAIDNFAASDTQKYLNPDASGESKSRETFGIAFQYPLFDMSRHGGLGAHRTITVYGQTTHGVRSTEVDCATNSDTPVCAPFDLEIADPQKDPSQRALYILRNASSLEAMVGLRFDLQSLSDGNAALYAAFQEGFVAVEDDDDDVADVNHFGIGARITQGHYRDSYIEIARGENDLLSDHPKDRKKVIARLVVRPESFGKKALLFAHIVADVDGGDGADSVQTYLGIAFCLWKSNAGCSAGGIGGQP